MRKTIAIALAAALPLLGACAPKNWDAEADGAYDIFEPINRQTYKLNKGLDWLILRPAGRIYDAAPKGVTKPAGNFLNNLKEPVNLVNNVLQKNGTGAVYSAARFAFNSALGVGGLFDVAGKFGVKAREADFGQTLRAYGLNDTVYFMLPGMGPASFADALGNGADSAARSVVFKSERFRDGATVVGAMRARAELLGTEELLDTAFDEYAFVRDAYEDRRRADVPADVWKLRY
jgi:phospholipid-binding lipoprotein MlaA